MAASGILDHPPQCAIAHKAGYDSCAQRGRRGTLPSSRRASRPRFCNSFTPFNQEGAGNAGCRLTPAVSCANSAEDTHTSIQVQPEQPGIPCAMGLRLIPSSPWRRIPLASIAGGLKALSKPGWISQNLRRLDTSHGCQNHTALPSATAPFVGARPPLTGFIKPALRKPACAPGAPRPPLPAPNVRDDRDTPLLWARDGGSCTGDLG